MVTKWSRKDPQRPQGVHPQLYLDHCPGQQDVPRLMINTRQLDTVAVFDPELPLPNFSVCYVFVAVLREGYGLVGDIFRAVG